MLKRKLTSASIALLGALALAIPAQAGAMTRDRAIEHVAWDYWNTYAPSQVADIQAKCAPDVVGINWVDYYPAGGIAGSVVNGCRYSLTPHIDIKTTLFGADFTYVCKVVTHEYGHLIGYLHAADGKSVMAGGTPYGAVPAGATMKRAEQMCRAEKSLYL
jgi:hypothetical protein